MEQLKVCVGYEIDGERINYLPASISTSPEREDTIMVHDPFAD